MENYVGNWHRKKYVDNGEKLTGRIVSKYVDAFKGLAQGCTLSPNTFMVYTNRIITAVEAAGRNPGGGRYRVGVNDCSVFRGDIRNTRRIEATDRETSRVH